MNQLQKTVQSFVEQTHGANSIEVLILDLYSEIGELSKEVLKNTNYGKKVFDKNNLSDNMESELGDVMYCFINIANYLNLDIEKCTHSVLEKYQRRLQKGGLGSEFEL